MFAVLEGSWNHEVVEVISIQQTEPAKNRTPPPQKKKIYTPFSKFTTPFLQTGRFVIHALEEGVRDKCGRRSPSFA